MNFSFKMFTFLAVLFIMSSALMAQSSITNLNQIQAGATYKVVNVHDGRALCTLHNSKDPAHKGNQEEIIVYDYYGDATQLWQIIPVN